MNHHSLHRSAITHDVAAAIVPVVVDESLELDARPPPQPGIDSLAVISNGTCHQLRVDSLLISTPRPWWIGAGELATVARSVVNTTGEATGRHLP